MINIKTNTITTSSDVYKQRGWKRSDPIPKYIYDIHRSLVEEEIITHLEIIKCSKEFIRKLDPDLTNATKPRRLKRCHYVNLCPICNFLRKEYVHMKVCKCLSNINGKHVNTSQPDLYIAQFFSFLFLYAIHSLPLFPVDESPYSIFLFLSLFLSNFSIILSTFELTSVMVFFLGFFSIIDRIKFIF